MRRRLTMELKLASALLQVRDAEGQPFIPWEDAKQMSSKQIISLFQFDHWPIRHEAGGPDEAWNLQPRLIPEHRLKTSTIDVPQVAKIKRISKAEAEFRSKMLAKTFEVASTLDMPKPKKKWPSRPFRKK